jgi:hypothetical protein
MKKVLKRPASSPILRIGLLAIALVTLTAMASSLRPNHETDRTASPRSGKSASVSTVVPEAQAVAPAQAIVPNQVQVMQQVNAFLGLAESRLVSIDLTNAVPGQPLMVHINDPVQPMTLELVPHRIRADGYQLLGIGPDGVPVPFNPGPERTLRGRVQEIPGSHVAGSLMSDGLYATVFRPDGERLWIEAVGQRLGLGDNRIHAIYENCDTLPHGKSCGMDAPIVDIDQDHVPQGGVAGGPQGGTICTAELANDADFEFFQAHGSSVPLVQDRIELVTNTMNVQYEEEVGITHVITTTLVRFAEPDPYTVFTNTELLCQFINEWVNFHSDIQRDVAQLWTGREVSGSVIGQAANIGNICDQPAGCSTFPCNCGAFGTDGSYCFVQSDFNGNFSCATDLSAHELGHLWDASHCSCPSNTMNPSITCANLFGGPTSGSIMAYRDTRQCLDCATPLAFAFPNGIPSVVTPAGGTTMRVEVLQGSQTPMPGTGMLHYSTGGSFSAVAMTVVSANVYDAVFPAVACGQTVEFYVSAEATGGFEQTSPANAPTGTYLAASGYAFQLSFDDNFEVNQGWTVTNGPGLTDGAWERGVPAGVGDRGDPPNDADGSGQCFLTDNEQGNSDVDGGSTTVTSPTMDATGGLPVVSYSRWFHNSFGAEPFTETFTVQVSDNNGATWSNLEIVGPGGPEVSGGWIAKQFDITSAGITATNQFRIRFTTQDPAPGAVVEAGVDAVRLTIVDCTPPDPCIGDVAGPNFQPPGDGTVDAADLAYLLGEWGPNPGSLADLVNSVTFAPPPDGAVDAADLAFLLGAWGGCP